MTILKTKKAHGILALLGALVFFLLSNTLINFCITNVRNLLQGLGNPDPPGVSFNFLGLLFTTSDIPALGYLFLFIATLIVGGIFYYKLRSNFKDITEGDAKGSSRFTSLKEIQQQYKAIPEKETSFAGEGGVPVSREGEQIYIDDSKSNNLWIGTTRSGKGEIGMFPMIDIYSRAEQPSSMVLNDPKGELLAASKETLERRGYHVEALNLIEPENRSMSFQILQMVIDAYEEGDLGQAEQHAKTIAHMLYSDPEAKDKFWQDSASSLCTALILGLCEKNLPDHPEKVTMYSVANTLNELASQQETDEKGTMISGLDHFFDSLPRSHPAKLQYATVKFASGAGQTVAGIFANAFDKLSIFTLSPIAKMTSHHSFDMRKIGFGKHISGFATPQAEVTAEFPRGTERARANTKGLFKFSHNQVLHEGETFTLTDHETGAAVLFGISSLDEDTGEVICQPQARQTGFRPGTIHVRHMQHFAKPTAVFLLTPDEDSSLHVIASLYVKQLYTELAKTSYFTPGRKCIRQVVFILDEFGNMPSISDMGNMVTVSLGRRIHFNLVVQDLSQIKHKYDKEADNIIGNCANKMYLLSTDYETNEEFSKLLGEKTISSNSRSGSTLSTDKNKTEGTDGRRLLDASELARLQPGEMVVYRGIKREDLQRSNVTPYPIYNYGKTRMKFRYEYLSNDFNTDTDLEDIAIDCEHADLDLQTVIYRFEDENTDHGSADQEGPKNHQPQTPSSEAQQGKTDNNQPADKDAPKQAVGISDDAAAFESKPVREVIDATLLQILDQQVPLDVHQMNVGECEDSLTEWNEAEWIPERMMTQTKDAIKNERRKYQKSIDKGENEHAEPVSSTTG